MTLFDNCIIQAPDGVNLSRCGLKKLNWYLSQGLATQISDDPPTIRLNFEPSGRDGLDDPLLLSGKPNICVVCGTEDQLTRHHIVPYCFIKHMEIEYKIDVLRDIFPLCQPCHTNYERQSQEKKDQMANKLGTSIHGVDKDRFREFWKATGAANTLLYHGEKIPEERKAVMTSLVKDFIGKDEVTNEDLKRVRKLRLEDSDSYQNFFKKIVENMGAYDDFAKDWREHFVATMKPKYMPEHWKVDRKSGAIWVPKRFKR